MPLALSRWAVTAAALGLAVPAAAQTPPQNRRAEPPGSSAPNVAATVNGEVIRLDQVDAAIGRLPAGRAPLTPAQVRRLRLAVVEDLIDDVLLKQFLAQHGPKVESAELDKHFQALTVALRKQGKTLADFYRETGQTEAQVRETWATLFRFQKYADQKMTDEALRKYYEANKDLFDRTTVRVSQIVLRVSPTALPGEKATARQKLTAVRGDVLAGKLTFAEAARKHSEHPSATAGGDLGFVGRRDPALDEPVARVAFAMPAGAVSELLETEFGLYLVTVTERKPGPSSAFEKVTDLVRDCYADDLRQQLVAHLRKQAQVRVTVP
jgi:peptidyl-prolyl cis-trans isomerase C